MFPATPLFEVYPPVSAAPWLPTEVSRSICHPWLRCSSPVEKCFLRSPLQDVPGHTSHLLYQAGTHKCYEFHTVCWAVESQGRGRPFCPPPLRVGRPVRAPHNCLPHFSYLLKPVAGSGVWEPGGRGERSQQPSSLRLLSNCRGPSSPAALGRSEIHALSRLPLCSVQLPPGFQARL